MSRKRWIYGGLLAAAAGAFLLDRLFLDAPEKAVAEERGPATPRKKPAPAPALSPSAPRITDPSLAWLEKIADTEAVRDVFMPGPDYLARHRKIQEELQARAEEERGPAAGSPELFEAGHQLQATTVTPQGGIAVVDGRCLTPGVIVDGYVLERIEPGRVTFRQGVETATLRLPMPPDQAEAAAPRAVAGPPAGSGRSTSSGWGRRLLSHLLTPAETRPGTPASPVRKPAAPPRAPTARPVPAQRQP